MQCVPSYLIKYGNRLISGLSDHDWERWKPHIEVIQLRAGTTLFDAGQVIQHVYFPLSGMISQQYDFADGKSAEFAQMGNEGMVGVFIFMGNSSTSSRALVVSNGVAYRLSKFWLQNEFNASSSFRQLILHYMHTLMTNASQLAVCNRRHTIDQQLCRTLLLHLERVAGDDLALTHDLISRSMGVRREGVSEAAKRLERIGAISYSRGHIHVLDRSTLLRNTCECYDIIKKEQHKLLPQDCQTA